MRLVALLLALLLPLSHPEARLLGAEGLGGVSTSTTIHRHQLLAMLGHDREPIGRLCRQLGRNLQRTYSARADVRSGKRRRLRDAGERAQSGHWCQRGKLRDYTFRSSQSKRKRDRQPYTPQRCVDGGGHEHGCDNWHHHHPDLLHCPGRLSDWRQCLHGQCHLQRWGATECDV